MRAEILSIGTELLLGSILNTNARFLSRRLAENGIDLFHQTTVGDNVGRILECLETAASRADLLITSGGLGPTEDDVTAESVSLFLKRPLTLHPPTRAAILRRLRKRGLRMNRLVQRQCYVPASSVVFQNGPGTAPGTLSEIIRQGRKKWVWTLPGPPRELEPMFDHALPRVLRLIGAPKEYFIVRAVKISGLLESEVAGKIGGLLKLKPPITVGIYAKTAEVELKIMAKFPSRKKSEAAVKQIEKKIRGIFKEKVYGVDEESLPSAVGKLLLKGKYTVAAAESCTGGLFSELLTDVPGSSNYFKGGVVSYSNDVKTDFLKISPSQLKKHGAVSAATAKAMAQNIRRIFGTHYGVGITGVAGPQGGSLKKPVGLVYVSVAGPHKTFVQKKFFPGNRPDVRAQAAHAALDFLRLQLL